MQCLYSHNRRSLKTGGFILIAFCAITALISLHSYLASAAAISFEAISQATDTPPGALSGSTFRRAYDTHAAINDNGDILFGFQLNQAINGETRAAGIIYSPASNHANKSLVAVQGGAVPGAPNFAFTTSGSMGGQRYIDNSGNVLYASLNTKYVGTELPIPNPILPVVAGTPSSQILLGGNANPFPGASSSFFPNGLGSFNLQVRASVDGAIAVNGSDGGASKALYRPAASSSFSTFDGTVLQMGNNGSAFLFNSGVSAQLIHSDLSLTTLANVGQTIPNGNGADVVSSISNAVLNRNNAVAFGVIKPNSNTGNTDFIAENVQGVSKVVARLNDSAPGTGGKPFVSLQALGVLANNDVIFKGAYSTGSASTASGLFRFDTTSSTLSTIFDTSVPIAELGGFIPNSDGFTPVIGGTDGNQLAFNFSGTNPSSGQQETGVFLWSLQNGREVLFRSSQPLSIGTQTVSFLSTIDDASNGAQTFNTQGQLLLQDSTGSRGLYLATVAVPEPATAFLLIGATTLLLPVVSRHLRKVFTTIAMLGAAFSSSLVLSAATIGPPVRIGTINSSSLTEVSGVADSRANSNVFWVHNDKGDTARFFAINHSGALLGTFNLPSLTANQTPISATDWEDVAIGPKPGGGNYLYFADIGDNDSIRQSITVYRVDEPTSITSATISSANVTSAVLRYQGGPRDAESLFVDPITSDLYIITKANTPEIYKFSSSAFDDPTHLTNMASLGNLNATLPVPTSADISPDGQHILVRSRFSPVGYLFERGPGQSALDALLAPGTPFTVGAEPQGEAIGWAADGSGFYTTSEMAGTGSAPIYSYSFNGVPEPSSVVMALLACSTVVLFRKRRPE